MRTEMEHQSPGQVFGQRVYETRRRLGLTPQQLADRLVDIGYKPMHRMTVTKIEAGRKGRWASVRAERASMAEVLAFAVALNVAPVHLITPNDSDTHVAITTTLAAPASVLRRWIRGERPLWPRKLGMTARGYIEWLAERPEEELVEWLTARRTKRLSPIERELVGEAVRGESRALVERLLDPDEFAIALKNADYLDTLDIPDEERVATMVAGLDTAARKGPKKSRKERDNG